MTIIYSIIADYFDLIKMVNTMLNANHNTDIK